MGSIESSTFTGSSITYNTGNPHHERRIFRVEENHHHFRDRQTEHNQRTQEALRASQESQRRMREQAMQDRRANEARMARIRQQEEAERRARMEAERRHRQEMGMANRRMAVDHQRQVRDHNEILRLERQMQMQMQQRRR